MLKEVLGVREGILADLHRDHEEVSSLLTRIVESKGNRERGELFREMMDKLLAHARKRSRRSSTASSRNRPIPRRANSPLRGKSSMRW